MKVVVRCGVSGGMPGGAEDQVLDGDELQPAVVDADQLVRQFRVQGADLPDDRLRLAAGRRGSGMAMDSAEAGVGTASSASRSAFLLNGFTSTRILAFDRTM